MNEHRISRAKVTMAVLLLTAIVAAVAIPGYLPRRERAQAAADAASEERNALPAVTVARVRRAAADTELLLPGSISSEAEASIFARAPGYVRKRYVDIGDRVKAGQLLAEIETPELDQQVAQLRAAVSQARQQLAQARASLVQSQAQRDLAKLTWQRYDSLVRRGAVARQDADQQESGYKSAEALVDAQQASVRASEDNVAQEQANLDRGVTLQDYQYVRAPFAGVITARNIEVGYLISASGAGQGASPVNMPGAPNPPASGNEMYRLARIDTLRIVVSVPQPDAPAIVAGMSAGVSVTEFPGRTFIGKVARTANSLDPDSRTLPVQVEIPNLDGKLVPGMFAQVRFRNHRADPPLLVPGDSIIAGQAGMRVAVLEDLPGEPGAKRIHLQSVQLGRDYGTQTEILAGLRGSETVVVNPGDVVREGSIVRPEARDAAPGREGQTQKQTGANGK